MTKKNWEEEYYRGHQVEDVWVISDIEKKYLFEK